MMIILGALTLAAAIAATPTIPTAPRANDTLRVVLVVDDTTVQRSLVHGAQLGAEEAAHTGALFGVPVGLRVVTRATFDSMTSRTANDAGARASVFIVAGDTGTCSHVVLQSIRLAIPVLDAGCARGDSARAATVYSLFPAATTMATTADSTRLVPWHWTLERFGGEQLNERFHRRFAARMDSPAWAGWLAMKIALDLALHAKSASGAALLHQLADPRAQFDGQKGRPLRFAPGTHRLIQPLYRITGSGDTEHVVAEVDP